MKQLSDFMKMIVLIYIIFLVKGLVAESTTETPTTHIVSYVLSKGRLLSSSSSENQGWVSSTNEIIQTQNASEIETANISKQLDNEISDNLNKSMKSSSSPPIMTDDLLENQMNTLDNADDVFGKNNQHESSFSDITLRVNLSAPWLRVKQNIPVLQPVKHLLDTLQNGGANQSHHHLLGNSHEMNHHNTTESAAIETEEEREEAIESPNFQVLEILGTIGTTLWGFLQRLFSASAALFSSARLG